MANSYTRNYKWQRTTFCDSFSNLINNIKPCFFLRKPLIGFVMFDPRVWKSGEKWVMQRIQQNASKTIRMSTLNWLTCSLATEQGILLRTHFPAFLPHSRTFWPKNKKQKYKRSSADTLCGVLNDFHLEKLQTISQLHMQTP